MNGKVWIVCLLQFVFTGMLTPGAFAAVQAQDGIVGRYTYGDAADADRHERASAGSIIIKKSDSAFVVDISVGSTGGGRGTAMCQFQGTGKISGNFLLVSNTVTHKNKLIPVTFKIYLNNSPELASYAKKRKRPEFGRLKPGQLAVIDDGEIDRQVPNIQFRDWEAITLPDEEAVCLMDSLSFDGVYTKETPGKQQKTSKTSPSFDCTKASNAVERAICADSVLADLDVQMATQYRQALNSAANKEALKKEQRQWLQLMHTLCSDAAQPCIQQHYRSRLSKLLQ